jgi:hypothetical protein
MDSRSPLAHLDLPHKFLRERPFLRMYEVRASEVDGGLRLGPDWYLLVEPGQPQGVDVSAARTCLELAGPHALDVLEHGCSLDLHPAVFTVGACAQTNLAKAQVILHRTGDDAYRVYVRSSYADYLCRWLIDAMLEYP